MWVVELVMSLVIQVIPMFAELTFKTLVMRGEGVNMLHAARLAMRIAIMLIEVRKGEVLDFSETKQPDAKLRSRGIQLLDMTETEIDTVDLEKGKAARIDAHKAKIKTFNAKNALINILDVSGSTIEVLDLTDSTVNVLDASGTQIKSLILTRARILNMDLSESKINNLVGRDSARVYIEIRWKSKIESESKDTQETKDTANG